jgi:hypothetical protein
MPSLGVNYILIIVMYHLVPESFKNINLATLQILYRIFEQIIHDGLLNLYQMYFIIYLLYVYFDMKQVQQMTKKGITRWFHKLRKNLYKNSIYFALLVHRQEDRKFISILLTMH